MAASVSRYSEEYRNTELGKLMHLTDFLLMSFLSKEEFAEYENSKNSINLELSNQISHAMYEIFTKLHEDKRRIQIKIGQKIYSANDLLAVLKTSEGYVAFDVEIAVPLVNYLTSFQLAYGEIKVSRSRFILKTFNGSMLSKHISSLGLDNTHLPLLMGISYFPHRRRDNLEHMGPLTLAIWLIYEQNWTREIKEAFFDSVVELEWDGMAQTIINVLRGGNQVFHLLKCLADYFLAMKKPSPRRIYFPLLFIHRISKMDNFNWDMVQFSGKEALQFYNKHARMFDWKIKCGSAATPDSVAQVVFHSIFDTTIQDLETLGVTTTNSTWKKRSDLDTVFTGLKTESREISFVPILFTKISTYEPVFYPLPVGKRYSNLGEQPQLSSSMVFDGNRKRGLNAPFKRYMSTGTSSLPYGNNAHSLGSALQTLAEEKKTKRVSFEDNTHNSSRYREIDETGILSKKVIEILIKAWADEFYSSKK